MSPQSAAIVNHSIGILVLTWAYFSIKAKMDKQAGMKIYGLTWKKIKVIIFVGIGCFVLLLVMALAGIKT